MAKLNDRERLEIVAAALDGESNRSIAKRYHVSEGTVRKLVRENTHFTQNYAHKKEVVEQSFFERLEAKADRADSAIDSLLDAVSDPEKIKEATLSQCATALGIIIDKFSGVEQHKAKTAAQTTEDDPLTKSLKETMERRNAEREAGKDS